MDKRFYRRQKIVSISDISQKFEFLCPDCKKWGKVTEEQLYGEEPIKHASNGCTFDEKIDLNIHGYEIVEGTIDNRPATFWVGTDGIHAEFQDGKKEKVLYEGAYPTSYTPGQWDPDVITEHPNIQFEGDSSS